MYMYWIVFGYFILLFDFVFVMVGVFVVLLQLKINVINVYVGFIVWFNFFFCLIYNYFGWVVWFIFNVVIVLLLMELGIYWVLEEILGVYVVIVVVWVGLLVVDLIINKLLGLSFFGIEFKCVYFYDINLVGFGLMIVVLLIGISVYMGVFNELSWVLVFYIILVSVFVVVLIIVWVIQGCYYIVW